jgi:hypothetical protein
MTMFLQRKYNEQRNAELDKKYAEKREHDAKIMEQRAKLDREEKERRLKIIGSGNSKQRYQRVLLKSFISGTYDSCSKCGKHFDYRVIKALRDLAKKELSSIPPKE